MTPSPPARPTLLRALAGAGLGALVACGGGGGGGGDDVLTPGSIDVTVDADAIVDSLLLEDRTFEVDHCAVVEGATQPGTRRLLRFDAVIVNLGEEALVMGDPADPEPPFTASDFELSPCHGHYHFLGWADYELRDGLGAVVAEGHKQAFCLLDSIRYAGGLSQGFHCEFQGLSPGWADVYDRALDGQWVDVTGVPAGDYVLVVTVNAEGRVVEVDDRRPNTVSVPVTLPDPAQPLP